MFTLSEIISTQMTRISFNMIPIDNRIVAIQTHYKTVEFSEENGIKTVVDEYDEDDHIVYFRASFFEKMRDEQNGSLKWIDEGDYDPKEILRAVTELDLANYKSGGRDFGYGDDASVAIEANAYHLLVSIDWDGRLYDLDGELIPINVKPRLSEIGERLFPELVPE